MLLLGLLLGSVVGFAYAVEPSDLSCAAIRLGTGMAYALIYSSILVKVNLDREFVREVEFIAFFPVPAGLSDLAQHRRLPPGRLPGAPLPLLRARTGNTRKKELFKLSIIVYSYCIHITIFEWQVRC